MADEIDDLLNRALGSYSDGEPLAGLEGRVLARVAGVRRRRVHWNWVGALACLVMVVGGVWVETAPSRSRLSRVAVSQRSGGSSEVSARTQSAAVISPELPVPRRTTVPQLSRDREGAVAQPRKLRLTHEELLLARFVAADPDQAAKQFASLNEYIQRDMTVQPLMVEPMKIEEIER